MSDTTTPARRTTRRKAPVAPSAVEPSIVSATPRSVKAVSELFTDLFSTINDDKTSFDTLQKEILEIRESWLKDQARHEEEAGERDQQEDLERRREREAYEYETAKMRKQAEDAFLEKKTKWEKELAERKDELSKDKTELETLRKQVGGFEVGVAKAVKEAKEALEAELSGQFATEKKLYDQEVKAEKELLALRITTLSQDNTRLAREIETLRRALDEASRQLKDIAVKVIESSAPAKPSAVAESA